MDSQGNYPDELAYYEPDIDVGGTEGSDMDSTDKWEVFRLIGLRVILTIVALVLASIVIAVGMLVWIALYVFAREAGL